jgi:hypothetical protein
MNGDQIPGVDGGFWLHELIRILCQKEMLQGSTQTGLAEDSEAWIKFSKEKFFSPPQQFVPCRLPL